MTVSYNLDVASSSNWTFLRLIFRWRGSIWKSVLVELCAWTIAFYGVFVAYRFALPREWQRDFADFARHIDRKLDYIPLTFILGFFVTIVVDRWKHMFANIGFIDSPMLFINAYVRGKGEEMRLARRSMARWLCLCQVLVLRDISLKVRKRFPDFDSLEEAGFLHPGERKLIELEEAKRDGFARYWMPINWVFSSCRRLRESGVITADPTFNGLLVEVRNYRERLQNLCNFDWVPVPLAYPQVVFFAVHLYFMLCLISRQPLLAEGGEGARQTMPQFGVLIPFMTMVQFVVYVGWYRVAEDLLNPLGEDDDDFECNYIIDRNITTALAMADDCHDEMPDYLADRFLESGGTGKLLHPDDADMGDPPKRLGSAATIGYEIGSELQHKRETRLDSVLSSTEQLQKKRRRFSQSLRLGGRGKAEDHLPKVFAPTEKEGNGTGLVQMLLEEARPS